MKHEANTWNRVLQALWKPNRMLLRIESGVSDGVPDGYIVISESMNWCEIKSPDEPARETTKLFSGKHDLSIAQRNWLLTHRQAGGRGWVLIETDKRLLLVGALWVDVINTSTVTQLINIAAFHAERPLKEADWIQFVYALTQEELP